MSDSVNIAVRVRENVRKELERQERLLHSPGPKYNDRYTQGKIEILKWIKVMLDLELEVLGEKNQMKEALQNDHNGV